MAKLRLPFIDYSVEKSTANMYVSDAILDAAITAIVSAVDDMCLGNRQDAVLVTEDAKDAGTGGASTNPLAHREVKWLVRATDDVNSKIVHIELPTADLSLLDTGTDFLDLSGTEAAALVTAIEANVLSQDGNAITVQSIQFVGRNL